MILMGIRPKLYMPGQLTPLNEQESSLPSYYLRLAIFQNGPLSRIPMPNGMATRSAAFVRTTLFIRLNL